MTGGFPPEMNRLQQTEETVKIQKINSSCLNRLIPGSLSWI